ncbi:CAF17-like 4Fe-4S cluster assembly/insertion protein YgfZ [Alcanivorax quisquiliarum]|uniref:Folate-binding protein n=1 Tax=Alcanivorax quisquiliarum TaxID=2933565 RepID=A0ABT0E7A7_9GAMM|nr:folate-binding protein [Alcanivorax quisquiliarum]
MSQPALWASFLDQAGAVRDGDGILLHFGQAAAPDTAARLCVADHLRVFTLRGPDAATFLQGQVTADVREISAGSSRLAMHLSLKGRGLVSLRAIPAEDGFDLLVPASMAESLRALLGKYILFSKATLAADESRVVLALEDSDPVALHKSMAENLTPLGLSVPEPEQTVFAGALTCTRLDARRSLLLLPAQDARRLWPTLLAGREPGGSEQVLLSDIVAGEGSILPGAEDLFLPQALNYDALAGVSFRKGCYTGQEVVARMHFKGQMKQRMQRLSWAGEHALPPGAVLRNAEGKAQGEIVQSIAADGRVHALAVLRLDYEGELFSEPDNALHGLLREPLPYPLPAR